MPKTGMGGTSQTDGSSTLWIYVTLAAIIVAGSMFVTRVKSMQK